MALGDLGKPALAARGESLMLKASVSGHDFSRAVEAVQWIVGFSPGGNLSG
jgi:hypothetical protein